MEVFESLSSPMVSRGGEDYMLHSYLSSLNNSDWSGG